jgi:hypothetical protein
MGTGVQVPVALLTVGRLSSIMLAGTSLRTLIRFNDPFQSLNVVGSQVPDHSVTNFLIESVSWSNRPKSVCMQLPRPLPLFDLSNIEDGAARGETHSPRLGPMSNETK